MSVTDTTSGLSLNDILANSSIKTNTNADSLASAAGSATGKKALGKDAFLQLLVTQLKNQNPLEPQGNGEFVAQLAQFSSLESMQSLNDSVTYIAAGLQSSQALQASSLVGRNVIVQTDKAVVDTSKDMKGTVNLTSSSTATSVGIYDKDDKLVRTLDLGTQKAGNIDFTWDGLNDDGEAAPAGTYTFKATASIDGKATAMTTNLPASVTSVTMGTNGSEMTLNLAGLGSVALSKIQSIGI